MLDLKFLPEDMRQKVLNDPEIKEELAVINKSILNLLEKIRWKSNLNAPKENLIQTAAKP